ncbi:MAG: response regulator transcription factor, partial [Cyanobacteria bacterium P01_G01_bin.49]
MSDRPNNLLVVDDDPIFCLGLTTALSSYPQWNIVAQVDNFTDALTQLANQIVTLVIVEPSLQDSTLDIQEFCQRIKQNYPEIKVCLLSYSVNHNQLPTLQEIGIEGFCHKGIPIADLLDILTRIIQDEEVWPSLTIPAQPVKKRAEIFHQTWLYRLQKSGINQINANLNLINERLRQSPLSKIDNIFWQGRKRELLTARWLIDRIAPVSVIVIASDTPQTDQST